MERCELECKNKKCFNNLENTEKIGKQDRILNQRFAIIK